MSLSLICMEPQQNLHETTKEFARTYDRICMEPQGNFLGRITELAWTHNKICMEKQQYMILTLHEFMNSVLAVGAKQFICILIVVHLCC